MTITDVKIRKITKNERMKAIVSVTFDNEFVIHDIRIIDGDKGLFVAMPSRAAQTNQYGEIQYLDVAHPINQSMRIRLQKAILEEYKRELGKE